MIDQKGILENIANSFGTLGKEVAEKCNRLANESNFYVLSTVNVNEITNDKLRIQYASYSAQYPDRTFEQFLNYRKNWNEDKYTFGITEQGYFLSEKLAVEYAKENMGDLYEAGSHPYLVISELPLNRVYPHAHICNHRLFEYNREKDAYEEIDWTIDEVTMLLSKQFIMFL